MKEFIESFGYINFIIIFVIVILIIAALVITIIIEKMSSREEKIKSYKESPKEENVPIPPREIVYVEDVVSPDTAKKELETIARKLAEDIPDVVGPTYFERSQEENSVISYQELLRNSTDIDLINDNLLDEEGNEPITIEELYKQAKEEPEEIQESFDFDRLDKEEQKDISEKIDDIKRFRNSDVISPVFGVKKEIIDKIRNANLEDTVRIEELDVEIKRTEEFLNELKKLKNRI